MKISVQATIFVAEGNEDAAEAALEPLGTRFLKGERPPVGGAAVLRAEWRPPPGGDPFWPQRAA